MVKFLERPLKGFLFLIWFLPLTYLVVIFFNKQVSTPSNSSGRYSVLDWERSNEGQYRRILLSPFFPSNKSDSVRSLSLENFRFLVRSYLPARHWKRALPYVDFIYAMGKKYQMDPFWIFSIAWVESHFNGAAVSNKGARGIMQILPGTYRETIGKIKNRGLVLEAHRSNYSSIPGLNHFIRQGEWMVIRQDLLNIEVGTYYLKELLQSFEYKYLATVAYNMGPNWTKGRLKRQEPVGTKRNKYLRKVKKTYFALIKRFKRQNNYVTKN